MASDPPKPNPLGPEVDDAFLDAQVEAALAALRAQSGGAPLTPAVEAFLREEIAAFLETNPEMVRMARRLRPRAPVEHSGTVADQEGATGEHAERGVRPSVGDGEGRKKR